MGKVTSCHYKIGVSTPQRSDKMSGVSTIIFGERAKSFGEANSNDDSPERLVSSDKIKD
mgnify:CR=1 FL=1